MMEQMLHPTPMPEPALKTRALKAAAPGIGRADRFRLLDLAIYWGTERQRTGACSIPTRTAGADRRNTAAPTAANASSGATRIRKTRSI